MKFVPMKELLEKAAAKSYAVPSFCVWSAGAMQAVLETAERLRAPVIVMAGSCEMAFVRPATMAAVARVVAQPFTIPAALHLDHGDSLVLVKESLDAGFTSVMLDFSTKPFAENAAALKQVVAMACPLGVTVEGEIGSVGKVDQVTQEGGAVSTLTDPDEVLEYVKITGVDALAVSIGNAHGLYTRLPKFDFERLAMIRRRVTVPLVLHGGSGTPDADIKQAVDLGMVKVNVASELTAAFRGSLKTQADEGRNAWLPCALAEAEQSLRPVVEKWIHRLGAEGRA